LADAFNASVTPYLICFHSPRVIIDKYGFNVELLAQTCTSMHGSSEGHSGYIYKRKPPSGRKGLREFTQLAMSNPCDPAFLDAYELVKTGLEPLHKAVSDRVQKELYGSRVTRARRFIHCIDS
jgi:hypothetical protein